MSFSKLAFSACLIPLCLAGTAQAESWFSGDWYLKVGAVGFSAPKYQGDNKNEFGAAPIISLGKVGPSAKFSSRNDSASFGLLDQGTFRAGVAAKLIMPRDEGDSSDLRRMQKIKLGGELGGFAEVYPTDWVRVRGEVRQGIRSHSGVVADLSADVFTDITPGLQISAGPRATWVSNKYNDKYYGVSSAAAASGGPSAYNPDGGLHSAGVGAAITWKATDNIELTSFAEYKRLMGDAGKSTLVSERGSKNQFVVGIGASYKFGFSVP